MEERKRTGVTSARTSAKRRQKDEFEYGQWSFLSGEGGRCSKQCVEEVGFQLKGRTKKENVNMRPSETGKAVHYCRSGSAEGSSGEEKGWKGELGHGSVSGRLRSRCVGSLMTNEENEG